MLSSPSCSRIASLISSRTRAPSKKMLEIMADEEDESEEEEVVKPAAAKSSGKSTKKKAAKGSSASTAKKLAADAEGAPATAKKTPRKKTPKAAAAARGSTSGSGKRKYNKRSDWWGNRSGINSPTAINRAKMEASAGKSGKSGAVKEEEEERPKPRRKYTKKSDFWKGKGKDAAKEEVPTPARQGEKRGGARSPKKDTSKSKAPRAAAAAAAKPVAKKKKAALPVDDTLDSDDSSVDLGAIVCCVCRCAVDYSDPDAFLPAPWMLKDKAWDEANKSDSSDSEDDESDEDGDAKKKDDTAAASSDDSRDGKLKSGDGAKDASSKKPSSASTEVEDDGSDEEEQFHPPLPHNLHDPNNALLLCDGPGCNRAYHQRCHFVPVLSIPRGEWNCLICRVKSDMLGTSPAKAGKGKKRAGTKKQAQHQSSRNASALSSAVSSVASADDIGLDPDEVQKALTLSELDSIYRVDPPPRPDKSNDKCGDDAAAALLALKQDPSKDTIDDVVEIERQKQLQGSFELVSAPLKARVLNTELTTKLKSAIDQSLSRIRRSENVIRAYTETSRARQTILDRYAMDGQVAQELAQAVGKIAMAKQRIRG